MSGSVVVPALSPAEAARSLPLRAYLLEARAEVLETLRVPGFALPSFLFPAMFYVFFGLVFGGAGGGAMATTLLATYGTFGVIGPALFGFGAGVAVERGLGWLRVKRAAPLPPGAYMGAKLATSLVFAALVCTVLFTLAATLGGVRLETWRWAALAGVLMAGSLPFCAVGLLIGTLCRPQAAPAVVNLVYLPAAFFSGLWIPIQAFPPSLQKVALVLPPYHLGQLALAAVGRSRGGDPLLHVLALAAFGILATAAALAAWKRADAVS